MLPGYISDQFCGVLNTFITLLIVNMIMLWAWLGVHSIAGFYVFTVLYGISSAGFQSLFPTSIASLNDDLSKSGTRLGMGFSIIGCSALIGGPIGGALVHAGHDKYVYAQVWAALMAMIGTSLIIAARITKHGWKIAKKC
jgi:MFS family permease